MEPLAVPFLELIYTFATVVQGIDPERIEISIYDWGTGSKWARLKIWFNSLLAKEETKKILEKAKIAAYAELFDKRINEAELSRAESEKLKKEALQLPGATHIDEHHRLDLEMKRLAVAEKAMQLQEKALEIKMKELDAVIRYRSSSVRKS
ncbi:hypothetical protein [Mucilaginibacter sp. PAMB04168]|uniref:hypothetical protein n=1 Tax=Mucilaginibacter sp. PAMB04168 TaxID=3138567 RepID=UPI0031F665EA